MLLFFLLTIISLASAIPVTELDGRNDLNNECKAGKRGIRKEWGELSKPERIQYTDAVLCLQKLPSKLNPREVPGAKSRCDDFLAVHINQTQIIHMSGFFLPWHRIFINLFETALQKECSYPGTLPYWNWALSAPSLTTSPLFDGSPSSLSGDGAPISNPTDVILGPNVTFSHGNGGGCVTSGPFANMSIPFRAFAFPEALTGTEPVDRFAYKPRCLSRDLNTNIATRYTSHAAISSLMASPNISSFQATMSGTPGTYALGVHGGGHFTLGSVGSDMFASPGDPAFWLHHGMIDRLWGVWQAVDPGRRQYAVSGTRTFMDVPPSKDVVLDDGMDWGLLGPRMRVREAMDVRRGMLCYGYTGYET